MRLNDKELALFAAGPADRDGRMYHKHLNHGSSGTGREGESCFLSWLSYSWWIRLFLWLFIINFQNMPYLYYFLLLLHVILYLIAVLISLNSVYFNYTWSVGLQDTKRDGSNFEAISCFTSKSTNMEGSVQENHQEPFSSRTVLFRQKMMHLYPFHSPWHSFMNRIESISSPARIKSLPMNGFPFCVSVVTKTLERKSLQCNMKSLRIQGAILCLDSQTLLVPHLKPDWTIHTDNHIVIFNLNCNILYYNRH